MTIRQIVTSWSKVPTEHKDAILTMLRRQVEFCKENGASKSAAAYEAAHNVLAGLSPQQK